MQRLTVSHNVGRPRPTHYKSCIWRGDGGAEVEDCEHWTTADCEACRQCPPYPKKRKVSEFRLI